MKEATKNQVKRAPAMRAGESETRAKKFPASAGQPAYLTSRVLGLTVDQCVDTSDLLEELDGASDEKTTTRLHRVVLEQVAPLAAADGSLESDDVLNRLVLGEYIVVGFGLTLEPGQNGERLFGTTVRGEPTGTFGDDEDEDEDGDLEDGLKGDGDTPCLGAIDGSEAIADPVGNHDCGSARYVQASGWYTHYRR